MSTSIRFGGQHSRPMVRGGAGKLAPLLSELCWEKYVRDTAEFGQVTNLDELDERNYQALMWHWVARIWLQENPMPAREALGTFDGRLLEPQFREYVRVHGRDFSQTGLDLEQCWALSELRGSAPYMLVVEPRFATDLGSNVSRIELDSEKLLWLLADLCFRIEMDRPIFPVLVSNGFHGHTILVGGLSGIGYKHPRGITVEADWFVFEDSWPARSLLALEQNYGGAKAIEDVSRPPAWVISPEDLNRVIVGFVVRNDWVEKLAPVFQSVQRAGVLRPPLWHLLETTNLLHKGNDKPIARAANKGLQYYESARQRFNLPAARS